MCVSVCVCVCGFCCCSIISASCCEILPTIVENQGHSVQALSCAWFGPLINVSLTPGGTKGVTKNNMYANKHTTLSDRLEDTNNFKLKESKSRKLRKRD